MFLNSPFSNSSFIPRILYKQMKNYIAYYLKQKIPEMYNIEGNKLCNIRTFYHNFCFEGLFLFDQKNPKTSKLLTSLFCSAAKCALVQSELERQD